MDEEHRDFCRIVRLKEVDARSGIEQEVVELPHTLGGNLAAEAGIGEGRHLTGHTEGKHTDVVLVRAIASLEVAQGKLVAGEAPLQRNPQLDTFQLLTACERNGLVRVGTKS